MTGYVRQSAADIAPGKDVSAGPVNDEFNQLEAAFNATGGHTHDGSSGNGPKINLTTSVTGVLPKANGGTGGTTGAITAPASTVTNKSVVGFNGTTGDAVLQLTPTEVRTYAELGTMAVADTDDFQPQNSSLDEISAISFSDKDVIQYRTGSGLTNRTLTQLASDMRDVTVLGPGPVLYAVYEVSSGGSGGTSYSGSWVTRSINSVKANDIEGASVTSDEISLPEGTYQVIITAPWGSDSAPQKARLRFYNISESSTEIQGHNDIGTGAGVSILIGQFTIAARAIFRIEHYTHVGLETYGLGYPLTIGVPEVYTQLIIQKVE